MSKQVISIEKVVEIILGLVLLFKGEIAFGCTLLTFGLITIRITV